MIELKNEQLAILVAEKGAELQSVKDGDGREYLWQAGPAWPRHSPILFPIVCSVNDETYLVDGQEYHLPRHGFARDMDFTLISRTQDKVTLALHDSEATLQVYPFRFNLAVTYRLEANKLHVCRRQSRHGGSAAGCRQWYSGNQQQLLPQRLSENPQEPDAPRHADGHQWRARRDGRLQDSRLCLLESVRQGSPLRVHRAVVRHWRPARLQG